MMQFLAMQAAGKSLSEIAEECFVSYKTVENTLRSARDRLEVKSTAQAIVIAIAFELLALDADGVVSVPETYNYLFNPAGGHLRTRAA